MSMVTESSRALWRMRETRPNKLWTLEILAGAIVSLKKIGSPVNAKSLEKDHKDLYQNIVDYPGGWRRMIKEAGYDPDKESRLHLRGRGYRGE